MNCGVKRSLRRNSDYLLTYTYTMRGHLYREQEEWEDLGEQGKLVHKQNVENWEKKRTGGM